MTNFRTLIIWQKGVEITKAVYSIIKDLPKDERFRIIDQITRAAVSIPSNIAEGSSRRSPKEYKHYLSISLGSVYEVETLLIIIEELEMISSDKLTRIKDLIDEEGKMLNSMIHKN